MATQYSCLEKSIIQCMCAGSVMSDSLQPYGLWTNTVRSIRFFKWATSKFKKKKGSIVIVDSLLGYPMHYPQVYKTHKKVNCVE